MWMKVNQPKNWNRRLLQCQKEWMEGSKEGMEGMEGQPLYKYKLLEPKPMFC